MLTTTKHNLHVAFSLPAPPAQQKLRSWLQITIIQDKVSLTVETAIYLIVLLSYKTTEL